MFRVRYLRRAATAASAVAFGIATAYGAGTPAGIVLKITGATQPAISEGVEIPADTPIKLGHGAELTFQQYFDCKVITVVGGTLTLSRGKYKTDGTIESERNASCLGSYSPATGADTSGLVLRGLPQNSGPVRPGH